MILDKIDQLLKEVQTLSAQNAEEIEQLRLKYLSRKGLISELMNDFRTVAADEKKTVGTLLSTANGKAMSAAVDVWLSSSPSSIRKRPGSRLSADISLIDLIVFTICFNSE